MVESSEGENQLVRVLSQIAFLQLVEVGDVVAGVRNGRAQPVVDRGDTSKPAEWQLQLGMKMLQKFSGASAWKGTNKFH